MRDRIIYLAAKAPYGGVVEPHRRLVAVLAVEMRFEFHEAAAAWYHSQGLLMPSNCMVPGNPPKRLEDTNGRPQRKWLRAFAI